MYENWVAAYRLRPFGDEQELLARIVSLLILVASKEIGIEAVMQASDSLMSSIMTPEWAGKVEPQAKQVASIQAFEGTVAKVFG